MEKRKIRKIEVGDLVKFDDYVVKGHGVVHGLEGKAFWILPTVDIHVSRNCDVTDPQSYFYPREAIAERVRIIEPQNMELVAKVGDEVTWDSKFYSMVVKSFTKKGIDVEGFQMRDISTGRLASALSHYAISYNSLTVLTEVKEKIVEDEPLPEFVQTKTIVERSIKPGRYGKVTLDVNKDRTLDICANSVSKDDLKEMIDFLTRVHSEM